MSKKETGPEVAQAQKFSIFCLREHCRDVLGVTPGDFDGAFFGATGEYTVEQAKAKITAWKSRKIGGKN